MHCIKFNEDRRFQLFKVSVTVRGVGMFMRLYEKSFKVWMY